MDFGLRDWLLILGPLFIVVVLLHGYWKMRSNRNTIKMALDKSFMSGRGDVHNIDDLDLLKAELPTGGARVVKEPEQQDLALGEDVPVLMEPVDVGDEGVAEPVQRQESDGEDPGATRRSATHGEDKPVKILVLNVLAPNGKFRGQNLLEALVDLDMRYGDMDIFHRFDGDGYPLFSLANAVEPGTFDLARMDAMQTPGVTLFMKVHELDDAVEVYNDMLEVADMLADELGGEVRDDRRSLLTPQTIEHCRQDIRDYQLKHA